MRLPNALDGVFRTASHVRILRALDELPAGLSVSAREIGRRAGVSHPTASSGLASLVEEGIVLVRRMPGVDAYELNEAHALTPPLRSLLRFERGLSDELFSFLRSRVKRVAASMSGIYVFGSAARGELTAGSDIDLAVICPEAWAERVRTALEDVAEHTRRRFGNRVSVLVGTRSVEDLVRRGRRGAAIWKRIVQDGIDLLGETAKAGRG